MIRRLTALYGAHPLQLVLMLAALALAGGAALGVADNPQWLRMLVWFAAAIVAHDLVAFPLYAAVDRLLSRCRAVNYVRVPLMASALTFVLFLPGIIRQGAVTYQAATGLTQEPFLARWLILCAVFFAASALVYLVRGWAFGQRMGRTADVD
ncbi:hypothetical protein [Pseudonocardia spinosispora]|uniref:hypothetical protein n=1 Tax=Pseudonocardia spinosispora TaxID=103441 RepID=UPI0005689134|nr:hypothetical protein [Pseudonocardia spinosispora]